jgi:hypothetical protein
MTRKEFRALAASLDAMVAAVGRGEVGASAAMVNRLVGASILAAVLAEGGAVDPAALAARLSEPPRGLG